MNKARIMIVVPYLTDGGAERVASLWANLLAENYTVTLATFYKTENEYFVSDKVNRITLFSSKKESGSGIVGLFRKSRRLKKVLKQYPQDLIIPFLSRSNIICSLVKNKNTIVTQTIRCNPWADPSNKFNRLIRDYFVKREKSVIVQNEEQASYFNKYKKVKKYVVCNPVNPAIANITKTEYGKINKIVAAGRLHNQKNYKMMIDAIKILKEKYNYNCILDIYGDGPLKEELNEYIKANQLNENVKLAGRSNSIFEVEVGYDLYLMTSLFEGFPNALLEAMALGLPVISTNCKTGPKDLIENGKNGYLLDSFDANDLADLIMNINEVELLKKVGTNAKEYVKIYSKENCLNQLNNCIEDLLKRKKAN